MSSVHVERTCNTVAIVGDLLKEGVGVNGKEGG